MRILPINNNTNSVMQKQQAFQGGLLRETADLKTVVPNIQIDELKKIADGFLNVDGQEVTFSFKDKGNRLFRACATIGSSTSEGVSQAHFSDPCPGIVRDAFKEALSDLRRQLPGG